jgi:hypothetical protein
MRNNRLPLASSFALIALALPGSILAHGPEIGAGVPRLESSMVENGHSGGYSQYWIRWDAVGNGHSIVFDDRSQHHAKHSMGIEWLLLEDIPEHYGEVVPDLLNMFHRVSVCLRVGSGCSSFIADTYFVPATPCPGTEPN